MVGYVHDSTTLWRIWDPAFQVVRSQSDVIFDKERNAHASCLQGDQTDIFELPEETEYIQKSTVEMDFSKHNTVKQVEMDFSITMQEPVEQVKAMEVVIMTVLTMIQITICPTLTTVKVSLQEHVRDHVFLMRKMHHRCPEKPSSTIDISIVKMTKPAEWWP